MSHKKIVTAAIIAGTMSLASTAVQAEELSMEKCYGVVKAGQNDCKDKLGQHSCKTHGNKDGDPSEWVLVPEGLCDKLVNGEKG